MKRLVLPLLILLFVSIVLFAWYREGVLPVKGDKSPVIFVVKPGESISSIAQNLENERLIRNRLVFYLLIKFKGIEKKIQAGDFRLSRAMSAEEIAEELTHGTLDVWVTVIEGMRVEEIAVILSRELQIPESIFVNTAKAKEGYLFPDTYLIPKGATSKQIVAILRNNFDKRVDEDIVGEIRKQGLSLEEGVVLASLLEREAQSYEDKRMVAGILLNRLRIDMPLQVDASVQYVLGYSDAEKSWWRKNINARNLRVDSLYNTYLYPGLPPGPIANPGLDSLQAIADARKSNYLYYLTDKNGVMHYAETLEKHNANIDSYLN